MGRLQRIRRIELVGGLRTLAEAEARIARLGNVAARLDALVDDLPSADGVAERKAGQVARDALERARHSVFERHANELLARATAAEAALRLKARADAVTRMIEAQA